MRYVQCYRCEAIQCREDNIRPNVSWVPTSTLDCFAAYQWYVSRVRWRLRNDGAPGGAPRARLCPAPRLRNLRPNPRSYPLRGGVPPAGGGVVSRAVRGVLAFLGNPGEARCVAPTMWYSFIQNVVIFYTTNFYNIERILLLWNLLLRLLRLRLLLSGIMALTGLPRGFISLRKLPVPTL
ncbi:MAG: hypothetical protein LBM98_11220 [Oscillospiraceae bacterium]|nr:hypothetical protein [Oscillospiraceae bacterium]